jgi:hypothetical protein
MERMINSWDFPLGLRPASIAQTVIHKCILIFIWWAQLRVVGNSIGTNPEAWFPEHIRHLMGPSTT